MKTPYELLGLSEEATDTDIKQAYLQKVRDNPPDRDQELFQQVQKAYETISNAKNRLAYALFTAPSADFNALLNLAFRTEEPGRPLRADDFMSLLSAGLDDKTILNTIPHKKS